MAISSSGSDWFSSSTCLWKELLWHDFLRLRCPSLAHCMSGFQTGSALSHYCVTQPPNHQEDHEAPTYHLVEGIDADVQSAIIRIHWAWMKAEDHMLWGRVIDTATEHHVACHQRRKKCPYLTKSVKSGNHSLASSVLIHHQMLCVGPGAVSKWASL